MFIGCLFELRAVAELPAGLCHLHRYAATWRSIENTTLRSWMVLPRLHPAMDSCADERGLLTTHYHIMRWVAVVFCLADGFELLSPEP